MAKSRAELLNELETLEKRVREIKRERKNVVGDYKDQIKDVESSIEQVLKELDEAGKA